MSYRTAWIVGIAAIVAWNIGVALWQMHIGVLPWPW